MDDKVSAIEPGANIPKSMDDLTKRRALANDEKKRLVADKEDDLDPQNLHKYHKRHISITRPNSLAREINVYVGIDFGTSYTKAFFKSNEGHNVPVEWSEAINGKEGTVDEDYFLPSTLYYENRTEKLYFYKKADCKLLFFKYGMIQPQLENEIFIGKRNRLRNGAEKNEFVSSIFYVANVIHLIKKYIEQKLEVSLRRIKFRFNMGCPIENWGCKYKGLYWLVLKTAYLLEKDGLKDGLTVQEIYEFYKKNKDADDDDCIHVIPELYAEAYSFINDSSTKDGHYTILDVGGGTVDFAVIRVKHINNIKKVTFISQSVLPLGIEMLLKRFYPDSTDNEYIQNKELLKTEKETIKAVYDSWETLTNHRERTPYEFRKGFNDIILAAGSKDSDLKINGDKKKVLPLYVYGGGANYEWYISIIYNHNPTISNADIPPLSRRYKKSNLFRLVIAENLANIRDYIEDDDPESPVNFGPCFVKTKNKKQNWEIKIADYGIEDDR